MLCRISNGYDRATEFNALDEGVFSSEICRVISEFSDEKIELHVFVPNYGRGWVIVRGFGFADAIRSKRHAENMRQFFVSAMEQIEAKIVGGKP